MRVPRADDPSRAFADLAVAVVDRQGTILRWSGTARALTGFAAEEVIGHPANELLADVPGSPLVPADGSTGVPAAGRVSIRQRCGSTVTVVFRATPLEGSEDLLVLAAPAQRVTDQDRGVALLHALTSQTRIGIALHDTDLAVVQANDAAGFFGSPGVPVGSRLSDVVTSEDARDIESKLSRVLETGTPVIRSEQSVRLREDPTRQWGLSLSAFRLEDSRGHPTGVAVMFVDTTERLQAQRRLSLAQEAAARFGSSLDVGRTAQDLADLLVPVLGDLSRVELAHAVFDGDDPPRWLGGGDLHMRHAAVAPATATGLAPGDPIPPVPDSPVTRSLKQGRTVILGRAELIGMLDDPQLAERLLPKSFHSVMVAPLWARGFLLGDATVWRIDRSDPFTQEDADVLSQVASRAALALDNARRYAREHRAAVSLQERLLPPATTDTPAAETAGAYLPAGGGAEIGGDWFDVLSLPSLQLALVVGDVVGHGMPAAAGMGRLRTAIQTLADLELEPGELLTRISDLVQRLAAEAPPSEQDTVGATCLYTVYDPITRRCTMASAGHPPPVVVRPDGTVRTVDLSVGPPLVVGSTPYESTTVEVEPGSVLALYTDGLIERHGQDLDAGLRHLTDRLTVLCRPGRDLTVVGPAILDELTERPRRDDMALLLARTRAMPAGSTAHWDFPADPTVVSEARESAARQLAAWGLDDLAFTTELIVSELVTNAIRHAGPPVGLRLIRHTTLICEVTDPSSTQPRLRRAHATDEGGRGLFLVAQLTTRWGCRYSESGKTIWAEQPIRGVPGI